jgi:hypothetical protein
MGNDKYTEGERGEENRSCDEDIERGALHGQGTTTCSERAYGGSHASRPLVARSRRLRRRANESISRLPLDAKGSNAGSKRFARWQAWTPSQAACASPRLSHELLPGASTDTQSCGSTGPGAAVRASSEYQSPQCHACYAGTRQPNQSPEGKKLDTHSGEEPHWQEGAGGLLLVAAAQETGLLPQLESVLTSCVTDPSARLAHTTPTTRRRLLLTLLFLPAVGLRRLWELRGYTGEALGVLTGRQHAYGYWHTARFLTQVAAADGAEVLTNTLGKWTAQLWRSATEGGAEISSRFYVDGHRKPVYTNKLLPRGLIGRSGKILGCRALTLLHDEQGHPLLAATDRGDQHLTVGLPAILMRYEASGGRMVRARVIVDREGMAAPFLRDLQAGGYTVITLLRTDQYAGLDSFTNVSEFVPLEYDQQGQVVREVAAACFALPLPDQAGQVLPLRVALIRDWRRQVIRPLSQEEKEEAEARAWQKPAWWHPEWKADPTPALPTTAKLIPIVTTAEVVDAVELAQTYIRRWPVQENIIRDWLLPLGLDTNHGYAKRPVVNSEVSKKRAALEKRLSNVKQWAVSARDRCRRVSLLYHRRWKQTKTYGEHLYRKLNEQQDQLAAQGVDDSQRRAQIKAQKATIDADLEERWQRVGRTYAKSCKESEKCERYAQQHCDLLRALEDLAANQKTMYELDNRKDQVMTVLKLALTNLGMWARDHYFPASYAHATWARLAPFFQLPGRVVSTEHWVSVELRPFNDRHLNQDLVCLCEQVNKLSPQLPDGRRLLLSMRDIRLPILDQQKRRVA